MDDAETPAAITRIVLRPEIRVAPGTDHAEVHRLVRVAHEACDIANSLKGSVEVEARVVAPSA